jgi:hypothetical protein
MGAGQDVRSDFKKPFVKSKNVINNFSVHLKEYKMTNILMNDEAEIYVPEGEGPAFCVYAAMFGPYTKPKARIDYSFPVFMIGVILALSDSVVVSSLGCMLAGFGIGMISKKVNK